MTRDGSGDAGLYTSVAIGADGLGLISYYDATNRDLKVAHCSNQMCTSATISSLDRTGDIGQYTSIALGSDDRGLMSYYDATNGDLKVAHCIDIACTSATLKTLDHVGERRSVQFLDHRHRQASPHHLLRCHERRSKDCALH